MLRSVRFASSTAKKALTKQQLELLAHKTKRVEKQTEDVKSKPKRKGFSSVPKLPQQPHMNIKDLLLDQLFSGYRPISVPLGKTSSVEKKPPVLYFELDDGLDNFLSGGLKTDFHDDKNLSRFEHSRESFTQHQEEETPRFKERRGQKGRKRLVPVLKEKE